MTVRVAFGTKLDNSQYLSQVVDFETTIIPTYDTIPEFKQVLNLQTKYFVDEIYMILDLDEMEALYESTAADF